MKRRLHGKNVLITGASTGIGQAIAIRFAEEGANVAVNYRSGPEQAQAVEMQVNEACLASGREDCHDLIIQADVSDEGQVQAMFAEVVNRFSSIDVLVNNAGIQKACASHEIELKDFDNILGVNLRGAFLCAREAIRHFLARGGGGVILNNSSVHEISRSRSTCPTRSVRAAWRT